MSDETLHRLLEEAEGAIRRGDKLTARRLAETAAAAAPGSREPWLLLARIAGPRARAAYLEQASRRRPSRSRRRKAIRSRQPAAQPAERQFQNEAPDAAPSIT
ncbi:MAG: hypothetical protein FJZ96_09450, partial [Chloroflexi bacterium]|nr:hypothetical protein [Chloroflexota bacterium]